MVAQKKKRHRRVFVVRFVCTSVLLMLATVLLFFAPIFTIDTTANTVLNEGISTIVEIAKTEAPETYSALEVPEKVSVSPRETIRVVFQLNSTVSIIQKIHKGRLQSSDGVYPILLENIQDGNVQNVITNLTVFSGFLEGSIFDKVVSVSIVLYGLVHILVMFFVFWSVVYQPLKFLIVRFLIRQPSASFEDFTQRYIGTLLLLVKYSVFSFCFFILSPTVGIGHGVLMALAFYLVVVLFNALMLQIDGTSEALNIVQGISFVSLLLYGAFLAFYIHSGYAKILGGFCSELIGKICTSFVRINSGEEFQVSLILWFFLLLVLIIFFVTLVIFFRNLFKHMACMGGLCVGFRKPKKDVIPNVLKKSVWFFFIILFVPLVISVFNKSRGETELSVLKDLNYYSYIICFVVFLLYLFSEFLFLKLVRMIDASAFFYEDNLKGNSRISPKLSFLFFMEREDDLRSTISNESIDIRNEGTMVHGSVPSYIPEEWLENNDSGHGSGKT